MLCIQLWGKHKREENWIRKNYMYLHQEKSVCMNVCWYLAAVDALLPRLMGSRMKPWLIDGNNTKSSCCITSDNGRIIIVNLFRSDKCQEIPSSGL